MREITHTIADLSPVWHTNIQPCENLHALACISCIGLRQAACEVVALVRLLVTIAGSVLDTCAAHRSWHAAFCGSIDYHANANAILDSLTSHDILSLLLSELASVQLLLYRSV